MTMFNRPNPEVRPVQVRQAENEVVISMTRYGIEKLIALLTELQGTQIDRGSEHIHVEDYEVLTMDSPRLTLVLVDG